LVTRSQQAPCDREASRAPLDPGPSRSSLTASAVEVSVDRAYLMKRGYQPTLPHRARRSIHGLGRAGPSPRASHDQGWIRMDRTIPRPERSPAAVLLEHVGLPGVRGDRAAPMAGALRGGVDALRQPRRVYQLLARWLFRMWVAFRDLPETRPSRLVERATLASAPRRESRSQGAIVNVQGQSGWSPTTQAGDVGMYSSGEASPQRRPSRPRP
jgi:hypothetical protein